MNDTPASHDAKQAKTDQGKRILERIEKGFIALADLAKEGHDHGMMDVCECQSLQNRCMALYYQTLDLHCSFTDIAKRNDCDVPGGPMPTPEERGGPGR